MSVLDYECGACGTKFRSAIAEARHRHNFPVYCKRNRRFAKWVKEREAEAASKQA